MDVKLGSLTKEICDLAAIIKAGTKEPYDLLVMPDNAGVFPGIKIGDELWSGELDEGLGRNIVVGVDGMGHALTCQTFDDELPKYEPRARWAGDWEYRSLKEAVEASARRDIEWHGPRLKYAEEALVAVRTGQDLQKYLAGNPDTD